jgi:hypothetical protein
MRRGSPEHRWRKQYLSASLMVAEVLYGTTRTIRLLATSEETAAGMMEAFYDQLNKARKW